jgi:hypothetical protein
MLCSAPAPIRASLRKSALRFLRSPTFQSVSLFAYFTPIHRASIRGHTEVVTILLKGGADPNTPDYEGYTSLHFAAKSGHYETAEALYRAGGDALRTNDFIFTPLDFAQRYRFDDIVMLLNTPRAKLPTPGPSGRGTDTDRSSLRSASGREKVLADILEIKE